MIGGATSTYGYNGDGLRTSRTAGGTRAGYVWDVGSALPVILQETAGAQTTYYVYGLDLIASVTGTTPGYYLTDGLGSTSELANGAGSVTDTYRYDAFGAIRTSTGASTQPFRYTGEQWDSGTGFYYLRARYYDPAVGRFLSRDPIGSLNRYAYMLNNPLRWIDPWGLRNLEGTPTPTPAGMVQVCVWVSPEGCGELGPWVEIPHGGGHDRSLLSAIEAYWKHTPDYFVYQHVVAPAWEFATSRTPRCYGQTTILGIWTTVLIATTPEGAPIWSNLVLFGGYTGLAANTGVACSETR